MGYFSNDYKTIKEKFRELRRMDIEWDVINENGNKVWTNTSPLSFARVIEGEGMCEYEFTKSLIPYLDRPAQYAKFSLAIQSKFKSGYGLALYENCERYRNIGYTKAFDVPTFRKLMGVDDHKYLDFFALKRRVIAAALNEVNQYADFNIDAEYEKKGRLIVAVRFIIKNKVCVISTLQDEDAHDENTDQLGEKLKDYFGLKDKIIERYLKRYGESYLCEKVETILTSDSFKNGHIKSMAGYLKSALSEDFQANVSSQVLVAKQRRKEEAALALLKHETDKLNKLKKEHDYYLSRGLCKLMISLTQERKEKILRPFARQLDGIYLEIFHREGLENVLIADRFLDFVKNKSPGLLDTLLSFEDYLKKQTIR
jgi:plasmid replication initiation protein